MSRRARAAPLAIVGAALYVLVLGWSMVNVSYDTWGALVVLPVIVGLTVPLVRRTFRREFAYLVPIALAGLAAKIVGSLFRYWVAFDAYGGRADSRAYHEIGKVIASDIRSGNISPLSAIPHSTGTPFISELTGFIYSIFGSSRLAGFFLFAWMGYVGAVFFVRAALLAVPGLKTRRYAALVFLMPSMIYWPSSIGKESWMFLCLGLASYGSARLLVGKWNGLSVPLTVAGITGAGFPRPHFAAIWVGALVIALLAALATGKGTTSAGAKVSTVALLGLSIVGLFVVAGASLRFLDPKGDAAVSDRVTTIFDDVEANTFQGGSAISTVDIRSPLDWPVAIGATLSQPMLYQARSFAELLPALETAAVIVVALINWRRLTNLGHVMRRSPYMVFAIVILLMFGLAFANISNLGILTRQRSLVMPMLFLPLCTSRESRGKKQVRYRNATPLRRADTPARAMSRRPR